MTFSYHGWVRPDLPQLFNSLTQELKMIVHFAPVLIVSWMYPTTAVVGGIFIIASVSAVYLLCIWRPLQTAALEIPPPPEVELSSDLDPTSTSDYDWVSESD